jgi:hypothetical protein
MFFGQMLFHKYGLYDNKLYILADYDFTLKTFIAGEKYIHSGIIVCDYLGNGISTKYPARIKI